jgi:hypothetical protein
MGKHRDDFLILGLLSRSKALRYEGPQDGAGPVFANLPRIGRRNRKVRGAQSFSSPQNCPLDTVLRTRMASKKSPGFASLQKWVRSVKK